MKDLVTFISFARNNGKIGRSGRFPEHLEHMVHFVSSFAYMASSGVC